MWISKKKHREILKEANQNHRINDLMEDVWELQDDLRELKDRVKDLEKKDK